MIWHLLAVSLFALTLSGCALQPPNIEVCTLLSNGAACTYTVSGSDRNMSEVEFQSKRLGYFIVSAEHWGEIKKFVKEACQKSKCQKGLERISLPKEIEDESQ